MGTLRQCPTCSYSPSSGWMDTYHCEKCGGYYCYRCPGSNQGSRCPSCYSEKRRTHERIYPH